MGPDEHRARAPAAAAFAVLTVSDSRAPNDDASGDRIAALLEGEGHRVARRALVRDDAPAILDAVRAALGDPEVEVLVTTGGTGAAPRDVTVETVAPLLEKRLDGFGEIFRRLSYEEIGPAAFLSRAVAGICRGKPVFVLPGSPRAVGLALERLVLPEIGHLLAETRRSDRPPRGPAQ